MNQSATSRWATQPYPLYIRKLDKKSRWGHASDDLETRSAQAATFVFAPTEGAYSLYLIKSDEDMCRVVAALNMRRGHPNEQIDLIAFGAEELQASGIRVLDQVRGETGCHAANNLHVDVEADSHDAYLRLCFLAMQCGREAVRIAKAEASVMVAKQREAGCEAFSENLACLCQSSGLSSINPSFG